MVEAGLFSASVWAFDITVYCIFLPSGSSPNILKSTSNPVSSFLYIRIHGIEGRTKALKADLIKLELRKPS